MNDSTIVTDSVKRFRLIGTRPIRPDGIPKVTGRAMYGADLKLPGMLYGKILRSPHAHARILKIDTSKAEALPGVKSVCTAADLPEQKNVFIGPERVAQNFWHITRNILAREKALYEGHAIAAVAATTAAIAEHAISLIEVEYEVLPHVIDVDEAMKPDAPLLFEDMKTRGVEPEPAGFSNISKRLEFVMGDIEKGFAQADVIIEKEFTTAAVHQAYIEPHACVAKVEADGQGEVWSSSQGHFAMRALTAQIVGAKIGDLRFTPAEIGGGFGGKTVTYLEPVAVVLSRKAGLPVRLQMTREEVFKGSGPTSGSSMWAKVGVKKDGTIVAADAIFKFQAGAHPGSPVMNACLCAYSPYNIENARAVGYDVVSNRPKAAAYRAPGSPIGHWAVESVIDMCAKAIGMDPIDLRLKNVAGIGTPTIAGPKHAHAGFRETLEALKAHPAYANPPKGPNQGRGVACGYWFNGGGESSATMQVNADGTVLVATGSPDIGGSRASMAIMAAETLGIDYNQVRAIVTDTGSVGYTHVTGGSRVTFATGTAVVNATKTVIKELCKRAAMIWDVDPDAVIWEDGYAKPAGPNAGDFKPLSLAELGAKAAATGGPITAAAGVNAGAQAPGFAAQFVDLEVDPETGRVEILKFVAAQDVGRAIHPSYVEGQIQGGVTQGIGWALNEEYIYNAKGQLDNAGFLDYRCPVASDVPMLDTILVEVPNPAHPYGVKGVGEACICPPMAAIGAAIENATGVRMTHLPMSPPRVLAALDAAKK
jgi:CO/xanthine dehydrogenase Mo-binding subunit